MPGLCPAARSGTWCVKCYEGKRGRRFYPGHFGPSPRAKRRKRWDSVLHRRSPSTNGERLFVPLSECSWQKKFPTVAEFLSLQTWPDGPPRQTGTITLLFEEGMAKAALNDRDAGSSCFVSAKTFTSLFERIERGLCDDSLEWRVKRDSPQAGTRKKA
jgi:hypothetical protein